MVYEPEFNEVEQYKTLMIGQKVISVDYTEIGDEGLKIVFENGTVLDFGFSGCEGNIEIR